MPATDSYAGAVVDQRRDERSDLAEVARLREALRAAEERARRTDDLLPALRRFADALAHATEPKQIIVEAVRAAVDLLAPQGGLSAGVVEYVPSRGALKFRVFIKDGVEVSLEDPVLAREGMVDDPGMVRPWQRIVTEPFIWGLTSDETVLHPDYRVWHEAGGAVAVAYVPLRRGERVVGFVGFSLSAPTAPSSEQSELIQALATQVSLALEMLRISDVAREAAVAHERELAAEERVRTLESTNAALTAAVTKIADVPVGRAPELLLVEVARAAGADVCYWLEYDRRAKTLEVTLRVKDDRLLDGPLRDEPAIFRGPFASDLTPAFEILRTQKAFTTVCSRSETPLMWPGALDWHLRNGRKEALAFAVQIGDEPLGLVGMAFVNERAMDDLVKQQLVRALANQFALALRLSRLAAAAERVAVVQARSDELEKANAAIRATATRLAEEPSLDLFLGQMLMELARALGTGTAVLTRCTPETDTLDIAAIVHNGELLPMATMPVRVAVREFAAWPLLCETKQSVVLFDVQRDHDLFWPGAIEWLRAVGAQACASVPIRSGLATIGQMAFAYPSAPHFSEVQEAMIEVICHQAALALQLIDLASRAGAAGAARAVSEERNRMAREIHDSLAQSFTSIALQSESLISKLELDSPLSATLGIIEKTARHGLAEARASVLALRPTSDAVGELQAALAQLAERCNISGTVACEFRTSTLPCPLSSEVRDTVLRIAQEAVNNALRHARASRILIEFDVHVGEAVLTVSDDGVGTTGPAQLSGGFGIPGMRARAESLGGTLTVSPVTGAGGTAVRLRVACRAVPVRVT